MYAVLVRLACKEVLVRSEVYAARVARQVAVDDDVASCSNVSFATEDILVDCLFKASTATDEDAHVAIVVGRGVEYAHQYAALAIELDEALAIVLALLCHLQVSIDVAKFEFEEETQVALHILVTRLALREAVEHGRRATLIFLLIYRLE